MINNKQSCDVTSLSSLHGGCLGLTPSSTTITHPLPIPLGCDSYQQPAPQWSRVVKSGSAGVRTAARSKTESQPSWEELSQCNGAAVRCNMNNLVFRGLFIIVLHCLGLRDGESHLWKSPTDLSLGKGTWWWAQQYLPTHLCVGKATGATYGECQHLVFVLVAMKN